MTYTPLLAISLACCLASAGWNLKRAARPAGAAAEGRFYLTALCLFLGSGALAHVFLLSLLAAPFPALEPFLSVLRHARIVVPAVAASVLSWLLFRHRGRRETTDHGGGTPG